MHTSTAKLFGDQADRLGTFARQRLELKVEKHDFAELCQLR